MLTKIGRSISCILLSVLLAASLAACGTSKIQVPDSVVEFYAEETETPVYSERLSGPTVVSHQVNKDTHTDSVLIEIIDETDFYTLTWTSQQVYQYNRASDLWVLLDYTDWDYEYEIKDFSGKEILSGTFAFSSYCSYQYKVVIDSVDTENETMTGDVWIRDQYCDCLRIIEDTVFDLALGNMGYYSYIPALVIELEKYEHPGCWGMSYGDLPLVDQA